MYKGELVDYGPVTDVSRHPRHFHTANLFNNFPRLDQEKTWDRGYHRDEEVAPTELPAEALVVRSLSKTFESRRRLFGKSTAPVNAVNNVSFTVYPGEVLGIIGGSGSGKTTLSRLILGLEKADAGEIFLDGTALHQLRGRKRRLAAKKIHMVFQDPYQSMRNSMTLFDIVAEHMNIEGGFTPDQLKERIVTALNDVHLPHEDDFLKRTPNQLSGGQRQRLAFARAVVANPRYIIADEPTSMLDVSLRQELLNLMEELRARYHIGFIFITHDLSLAYHFCDSLMVMKDGAVVEQSSARRLIHEPRHAYTRELISAIETPVLQAEHIRVTSRRDQSKLGLIAQGALSLDCTLGL
jgi:ABC-type glutathione transport system ATPase component